MKPLVVYYLSENQPGNRRRRSLFPTISIDYDGGMSIEGTRRVMETNCVDTANQYLRFGWSLINQYVVEPTGDESRVVKFVLASLRRLEDTREVVVLSDPAEVNEHLRLGWKLIDKHVTAGEPLERRDETMRFVLAWQSEDAPQRPGSAEELRTALEAASPLDEPR